MQRPLEERILIQENIAIPRKIVKDIILHKHYKAFIVFLQLKPLYVSGVLMNDGGKFPYRSMAVYCGISISGLRGKIKQLKKHKLIRADKHKNFHLASYKTFVNIFQPQFLRRMKKYVYRNVASADELIKTSAIRENLRRQEYVLKKKIINKEIYGTVNAQKDRIKQPEGLFPLSVQSDCQWTNHRTDLSKTAIRKIRKIMLKDYDNLLHKHKGNYLAQMEQVEVLGFPDINPYITLSCAGVGRLFGLSASAGHYQREKLLGAKTMLKLNNQNDCHRIYPMSNDGRAELARQGSNVFSYYYPIKRGKLGTEEKFFIHLPDRLSVNLNFLYESAKN